MIFRINFAWDQLNSKFKVYHSFSVLPSSTGIRARDSQEYPVIRPEGKRGGSGVFRFRALPGNRWTIIECVFLAGNDNWMWTWMAAERKLTDNSEFFRRGTIKFSTPRCWTWCCGDWFKVIARVLWLDFERDKNVSTSMTSMPYMTLLASHMIRI